MRRKLILQITTELGRRSQAAGENYSQSQMIHWFHAVRCTAENPAELCWTLGYRTVNRCMGIGYWYWLLSWWWFTAWPRKITYGRSRLSCHLLQPMKCEQKWLFQGQIWRAACVSSCPSGCFCPLPLEPGSWVQHMEQSHTGWPTNQRAGEQMCIFMPLSRAGCYAALLRK